MSTEANKTVARRVALEIFSAPANLDLIDQVIAPDYVEHSAPPGVPPTREGFREFVRMFIAAFPDCQFTIDQELAEGNLVAHHVSGSATMRGEFMGMPPTGRSATWTETHIIRIVNGKIVEHWSNQDDLGMLQQLGLAPTPEQAPA